MDKEMFLKNLGFSKKQRVLLLEKNEFFVIFKNRFQENLEKLVEEIEKLSPKEQLQVLLQLGYDSFLHSNLPVLQYEDLYLWSKKYQELTGTLGIMEIPWLLAVIQKNVLRMGRLQFEPDEKKQRIHVHVPEGVPLTKENISASFKQALKKFPSYEVFDCDSWLLSPALKELLKPESGILIFQSFFHLTKWEKDDFQGEERIFNQWPQKVLETSLQTSLQKKATTYLAEGNKIGIGIGEVTREELIDKL